MADSVGFEPTERDDYRSTVFRTAGISHSPNYPLNFGGLGRNRTDLSLLAREARLTLGTFEPIEFWMTSGFPVIPIEILPPMVLNHIYGVGRGSNPHSSFRLFLPGSASCYTQQKWRFQGESNPCDLIDGQAFYH